MALQSYLIEAGAIDATAVPRGGSYVSLPAGAEVSPRPEGSYVSHPEDFLETASRPQGTYVTLPGGAAGETEISYTRVG
ncbi:hypothetical protein Achl_3614 [Pseudarthrobacter chlorophenolicus A6]|uniref:Uncharacterized protein n=1 Tax=Pseudarthrobacter chlorophenolicus (strain ATCC 700700 / DSM 12829 / CIP 107037 / JCM 12360 / KCTC 9906 / NCIMB 13794 / A6) TaxID=452863 RepID=B8H6P4_PSECP|nr:hypothetical protein [Pseudarthrobacter chlorophenolicus]ACL41570.1 hypothetical protein Achl_3614 [Pseudarthrobacter chlorophenolicus A6]SDQ61921.1 hypothetical protein SAMN04489738_1863 [Pseudarthrobacter chlorophenolicus]